MFIKDSFFNQLAELRSTSIYKLSDDVTIRKRLYAFW